MNSRYLLPLLLAALSPVSYTHLVKRAQHSIGVLRVRVSKKGPDLLVLSQITDHFFIIFYLIVDCITDFFCGAGALLS